MRVDAHVHVFVAPSERFPRLTPPQMPATRQAPVEDLLRRMDANAIDRTVLVQTGGSQFEHHAYLLDCLARFPDRFVGIGLIPDSGDPAAHMDRLAAAGPIVGFRLNSLGGPADPLEPVDVTALGAYPIWRHAAAKDYVLWLYLRARDAHLVGHLLEAFPQVRTVFNHMMLCPGEGRFSWDELGRPRIDIEMPPQTRYSTLGLKLGRLRDNTLNLFPYDNVRVHLSGQYAFSRAPYPYADLEEWHYCLYRALGPDRLMWASDYPWITTEPGYDQTVAVIDRLMPYLPSHERRQIMGHNAQTFLRLK